MSPGTSTGPVALSQREQFVARLRHHRVVAPHGALGERGHEQVIDGHEMILDAHYHPVITRM
jgi:hypothetical protein